MVAAYAPPTPDARRAGFRVIRDEDAVPYDGESPERRAPFVIVDAAAGETILGTLGPSAFAVYWHLCKRANGGECWPSLDDIADATTLSRKHVTRMLDALDGAGWIGRERRTNRFGMATSTAYRILGKSRTDGCDIDETRRGHDVDMTASQMSHELDTNQNQTRVEPNEIAPPLVPQPATRPEPKARLRSMPTDFAVTEAMRSRARDRYGLTDAEIDAKTERFRTWAAAKGQRYADWDAGWLNFMEPKSWDGRARAAPSAANGKGALPPTVERGNVPKDGGLAAYLAKTNGRT